MPASVVHGGGFSIRSGRAGLQVLQFPEITDFYLPPEGCFYRMWVVSIKKQYPGLGGKIGFDATNKLPGETRREWGRPIVMDEAVKRRVDALWTELGID